MTDIRHVVWDWNGTLLDDLPVVVESVNHALESVGVPPIDAEGYRDHYTRPVVKFYEAVLRRAIGEEEWLYLDEAFHVHYRAALDGAPLRSDAWDAMRLVAAAGRTQSILSMWWHTELVPAATRFGLDRMMVRIDGTSGGDPGSEKAGHLARHISMLGEAVPGLRAGQVLVVGDVPDDGAAARTVGARCVMLDGGSHHLEHLVDTGWPVAHTLVDAVRTAGVDSR